MPAAGRSSNLGFQAIQKIATTCASIQFALAYNCFTTLFSRCAWSCDHGRAGRRRRGPPTSDAGRSARPAGGRTCAKRSMRATRGADLPRARSPGRPPISECPGQPTGRPGRTGRSGALRGFFDVKVRGIGTHTGEIHREPEPNGRRAKLSMVPRLSHRGRSHGDEY